MVLKLYCAIPLLFLSLFVQGQDSEDSPESLLLKKLSETSSDTAKISVYHKLAGLSSIEDALKYEQQALDLARSIQYTPGIIASCTNMGSIHRQHSDYFKAIPLYKKAIASAGSNDQHLLVPTYLELGIAYLRMAYLDSATQSLQRGLRLNEIKKDPFLEASLYNMLGNVMKDQNDYQRSIEYYLKSVDIFRDLNNKSGLTQAISNVGNLEYVLGSYGKALSYTLESLAIAEEIDQQPSIAYSNRLLGRIYRKQGKLDEALASYAKAVEIYSSLEAKRDVSETYYNTGNIHYEKSNFNKAIEYYQSALSIQRAIPDSLNMAYSYSAIGQAYYELKEFNNTLRFLDSAMLLAARRKLPYVMLDVYNFKSMIYAELKLYDEAYRHHVLYATLKDSLTLRENRIAAQELENKYQQEKKEEEIKALNAAQEIAGLQLARKNTQRNYLLGISVFAVVLVGVLYNRYKIKLKATKKLEELDRIKSRFFTNLSHEFRTPLSLIIGPLMKKIKTATDPEEKEELELMNRNAQRLVSLINQLLDLSRLESGNMKLRVTEGDFSRALRLMAASFSSFAEHKGISFSVDIRDAVGKCYFDHDKIEQVVYNLLSNALKFTPSTGTVCVEAHATSDHVFVSVSDSGIGIPSEKLPYVFDRFYQVDNSPTRRSEGSGIGLALCREIIELHKGRISVVSEEGKGSTFSFKIPVVRTAFDQSDIVEFEQSEKQTLPVSFSADGEKDVPETQVEENRPLILVAEDNADMRQFISGILKRDYYVISAADGREAFERAVETVPDLIITDVMMPNLDGKSLCDKVKHAPATSHVPVIMLTAKADLESKLDGLQTGADDYLTKPFHAPELLVRIHNLIEQRRQLQEVFRERIVVRPEELNLDNPAEKFLSQVNAILEKNYNDPMFGVDQFADLLAMSRTQLHRKLKGVTNTSPGDFLRQFRLERSKMLLVKGFHVSDVAYQTGFNNLSNFTKAFKDFTGFTPSEFSAGDRSAKLPVKAK